MRTFILEWRPSISSYKMKDFNDDLHYLGYGEFNWSVYDWKEARSGDNFYMVKCSEGCTGIVMKGFFISEPYLADDWSGRKREVHYMDMRPTCMVHPDMCPVITTAQLEEAMPDFQWNGGHSGRLLPSEYASLLDRMWDRYITDFPEELWTVKTGGRHIIPEAGIDDAVNIASRAHMDARDLDGNPVILHALAVGMSGKTDQENICGFLHDVIEDTDYSAGELREEGFSESIIDTLMLLTHEKDTPYMDYIHRIVASGNKTAIAVKMNDLRNNLERGREGCHERLVKKHSEALAYMESNT